MEAGNGKKGYRPFLKEADLKGVNLNVIPGVAALMDEWIEKGHGKDDWTIIGKVE